MNTADQIYWTATDRYGRDGATGFRCKINQLLGPNDFQRYKLTHSFVQIGANAHPPVVSNISQIARSTQSGVSSRRPLILVSNKSGQMEQILQKRNTLVKAVTWVALNLFGRP